MKSFVIVKEFNVKARLSSLWYRLTLISARSTLMLENPLAMCTDN
jgi:hypothetical protein